MTPRSTIPSGSPCRSCRGQGTKDKLPCESCSGTGRVKAKRIERQPDLAAFDMKTIRAIWQPVICPLTGLREGNSYGIPIDIQHVLGRGGGKYVYSSPLNAAPICRLIHAYGNRDHRYIRAFLLVKAREAVDEAIRDGRYVPTPEEMDRDAAFAELSADFLPNIL